MKDKTSDDRAQRAIPPMTGAVNLLNKLLGSDDIKTGHKARLRTVLAEITATQQRASESAAAQDAVVWQWRCPRADTDWSDCDKSLYDELRRAMGGEAGEVNKMRYEVRALYAAPVAAAPVDLDAHGLRALDNCIADLRRLLELAKDYDLDVMQMQSLETAIESMELRKVASTPAAPGIDPADPWRGLYAPELMPKLDGVDVYHVAHPDLPSWPKDEDEERGIAPLVKAQGFELEAVFGEYPEDDDEDPDYCAWLAQWQPTPPTGEHWRLVCIQDTEDGPAAFYVRPFALIDASPKGGSIPASRFELTNGQIAQLADFAGTPVAGEPLNEQDVLVIQHAEGGHSGPGLYAHHDELPEEGAIYLDGQLPDSPQDDSGAHQSIASAIAELESPHVQNNKFRMGCLGADNIDTAVRLLTALQATSAEVGS
ncbi:hypothetical protein IB227_02335 [Stenotrophomonas sp. STM01]|uniref:hypothetical protein n=1 Tax=Stenotrophomonas sp. STM01 TaxID=2769278 RepID=UPI00177D4FAA|nr:hypothetical protein [Stenotrophomonas sp. STM01]MBD9534688.1 hypothetical protein [Stenotrophomonas sp. STM01]